MKEPFMKTYDLCLALDKAESVKLRQLSCAEIAALRISTGAPIGAILFNGEDCHMLAISSASETSLRHSE
jgi:hypothetical protein